MRNPIAMGVFEFRITYHAPKRNPIFKNDDNTMLNPALEVPATTKAQMVNPKEKMEMIYKLKINFSLLLSVVIMMASSSIREENNAVLADRRADMSVFRAGLRNFCRR